MLLCMYSPGAPKVDLQDIISTSTEPAPHTSPQLTLAAGSDPTEKKLGKLRKKLQQVESLKERRDRGEKLETNQVTMVDCVSVSGTFVLVPGKDGVDDLCQVHPNSSGLCMLWFFSCDTFQTMLVGDNI